MAVTRPSRRGMAIALVHAAAFAAAYWFSYALRFGLPVPGAWMELYWVSLPLFIVVKLGVFYAMGHWRFSWRHPTFSALTALLRSSLLSTLLLATLYVMFFSKVAPRAMPRSILGLDCAMTILTLGGLRSLWRMSREELRGLFAGKNSRRALIVGANPQGEFLARQFLDTQHYAYHAVGFLDDDPQQHGSRLAGIRVLGGAEDAGRIAAAMAATDVLVISGTVSGQRLRELMERCKAAQLRLKVIPDMDALLAGDYSVEIRDVDINDLLRREPVELSGDRIATLVTGRTVMVTGAGGSIGAEICRQVLKFRPKRLLLVERAENSLFEVEREFQSIAETAEVVPALADICDAARMEELFGEHRPDLVFHAAAHKHVPMMERNPGEAIKNNVLATVRLSELADDYGVEKFVLISTDKAVRPSSVMGASKRLAEQFVHAFSQVATTNFSAVRFGNVLGSAGSVVPIFQEQIRQGGPVTVTHPEMSRFFMTIPEAAQLVLQAAAMGAGGEVFVLDMGRPIRIVDLARDLIRLSRVRPGEIEIQYTGMRPGEKLHEELYCETEQVRSTLHPKINVAHQPPVGPEEIRSRITQLAALLDAPAERLRAKLQGVLTEYHPVADRAGEMSSGSPPSSTAPRVGTLEGESS